ncbi:GntR family transcriptional regulator [Thiospirochaeta perfilievii]|uniref:GntR family transcriptional regulator n=1 Tax=Thiospirochaeta perfilievii TaxID=252967 RepID=A0A5C1QCF1_9SPIO|nr:GntR family transcriptional regulator [Thiospirochaeta perfilievii]QEN05221.1 GntR family transcriptional regulator [Thiospirochaeta perfilievii]
MEFNSKKPIYYQISDLICENILLNKFKEDERISSVRDLAVELEVNPNTVMRAYSFLQDEEIIFNKRGIGYFISKDAKQLTLRLKKDSFIKDELPNIFKESSLYGIDPEDLKKIYIEYLSEDENEKK